MVGAFSANDPECQGECMEDGGMVRREEWEREGGKEREKIR